MILNCQICNNSINLSLQHSCLFAVKNEKDSKCHLKMFLLIKYYKII